MGHGDELVRLFGVLRLVALIRLVRVETCRIRPGRLRLDRKYNDSDWLGLDTREIQTG